MEIEDWVGKGAGSTNSQEMIKFAQVDESAVQRANSLEYPQEHERDDNDHDEYQNSARHTEHNDEDGRVDPCPQERERERERD